MGTELVVVGLGYVGLPVVVEASRSGLRCVGFDVSASVVAKLAGGRSHVDDIDDQVVAEVLAGGTSFSDDADCLDGAEVVVVCVPTPLKDDRTPDLSAVESASRTIAARLRRGTLVVLESTTYPGTTDGLVREILETSGLRAGTDFHLAFSPERIDPGNPNYSLKNTPKVVGGLTPACTERAAAFYGRFVDEVVPVSGPREAEMAKLLENTYRHVNIALVNEMAVFSHDLGIDLWEAIRAAETKPFGFAAFRPGPGVGGHCIPIDPNYLSHQVRSLGYQFRFVELAQEISGRMPAYVVARVQDALNDVGKPVRGSRVLVLGLTYKPDIADARESPATGVIQHLRRLSADVVAHDPHLDSFVVDGEAVSLVADLPASLATCDLALLLQTHSQYDLDEVARLAPLVFDTRGRMRHPNVYRL
ncbi:MAG: nucleotide sugar dehydrogenase [Ilumatobacteraceae bacterium]